MLANHLITLDGQVIGGWKRSARPPVGIETKLITAITAAERKALKAAERKLAEFFAGNSR